MHIHARLKDDKYPNCRQLSKELEVCTRTIKRDLDFMKERLRLPIEYDELHYGFHYTQPVDKFPGTPITEADMFALLVAHKAVAQYRGTSFHQPLETAFRKLTSQLDQHGRYTLDSLDEALSFRPFAPEDTDLEKFQAVAEGVQQHRELQFSYRNLGARQAQARRVRPYHLACIENHWYLFAWDVHRQAMRTFVLTRLSEPKLTNKRFKRPKTFDADEYLKGSFTVFKGGDDYEVVVDLDAWATDLIRGRTWHPSQEFSELPGGCSRMRFRLNSIEELDRWVLSWGIHATVVRPKALAGRIWKIAADLAARYENSEP